MCRAPKNRLCVTTNKCWCDWSGLIKSCIWSGVRGRQNWKPEGVYPTEHRVCLGGSHCVTHFRRLHETITIKTCLLLTGPPLPHRLNFVTDNKWCPVAMPRFVSWYQLVMSQGMMPVCDVSWCPLRIMISASRHVTVRDLSVCWLVQGSHRLHAHSNTEKYNTTVQSIILINSFHWPINVCS